VKKNLGPSFPTSLDVDDFASSLKISPPFLIEDGVARAAPQAVYRQAFRGRFFFLLHAFLDLANRNGQICILGPTGPNVDR